MIQVIVSGSRHATQADGAVVLRELRLLHEQEPIGLLIEGGARGVDTYARLWASTKNIEVVTVLADWKHFGRAAGHIRNRKMLTDYPDARVLAFPKALSPGTRGMIAHARELGRAPRIVELKP